jgi:hypothetical protein
MGFEKFPKKDREKEAMAPQEPGLEIVPTEKQPEISHVPPDVAGNIIGQINEEERQEKERIDKIDDIIRRKMPN